MTRLEGLLWSVLQRQEGHQLGPTTQEKVQRQTWASLHHREGIDGDESNLRCLGEPRTARAGGQRLAPGAFRVHFLPQPTSDAFGFRTIGGKTLRTLYNTATSQERHVEVRRKG